MGMLSWLRGLFVRRYTLTTCNDCGRRKRLYGKLMYGAWCCPDCLPRRLKAEQWFREDQDRRIDEWVRGNMPNASTGGV